jgi:hypothetical protein
MGMPLTTSAVAGQMRKLQFPADNRFRYGGISDLALQKFPKGEHFLSQPI